MLKQLLIKNYALIKHLEIEPSEKLNIITGETGAGKSIMLGALGLLLGNRADTKALLNESEKCIVEASFQIKPYRLQMLFEAADLDFDEHTCTIRREISPSGKSRAFINDTPVTLDVLREISEKLMDIHSQHDTLMLAAADFQRGILDAFAQNQALLTDFQSAYTAYRKIEAAYKKIIIEAEQYRKEFEFNQFLLDELTKIDLENIDQEALEQELEILENAENIKAKLGLMLSYLSLSETSAESLFRSALGEAKQIENYANKYKEFYQRLNSIFIELRDVVAEMENEEEILFYDEERATNLQEKLNGLYVMQKKHKLDSVTLLLDFRKQLDEKVNKVLNFDNEIASLEAEKELKYVSMIERGKALSASRNAVAPTIATQLCDLLLDLGMPDARVAINIKDVAPDIFGLDEVNVLFSANKGVKPETLKEVASGGEFSRLMLALKYLLAGKTALPTIIFDEIDTGISGEIAIKVAKMMKEMSKKHQLIVISHLPQTAANGNAHYFVYKDNSSERAVSKIKKLNDDERVSEIAQMIGGNRPSETAVQSAKELLKMYEQM